jgi:F0F1-type ATP synthase assembly protein I
MDESSKEEQSKDFITWDDLAKQKLPEPVNNDLDRLLIQEAKLWPMRWAIMIIVAILVVLLIAYSVVLYFLTRSPFALLSPAGLSASVFIVVRYAGRFAFWRENDYRLEAKKLELGSRHFFPPKFPLRRRSAYRQG